MSIKSPIDLRVVAAIVALAVALGVINNLRVYDEQRVHWFGGPCVSAGEMEGDVQ